VDKLAQSLKLSKEQWIKVQTQQTQNS